MMKPRAFKKSRKPYAGESRERDFFSLFISISRSLENAFLKTNTLEIRTCISFC